MNDKIALEILEVLQDIKNQNMIKNEILREINANLQNIYGGMR